MGRGKSRGEASAAQFRLMIEHPSSKASGNLSELSIFAQYFQCHNSGTHQCFSEPVVPYPDEIQRLRSELAQVEEALQVAESTPGRWFWSKRRGLAQQQYRQHLERLKGLLTQELQRHTPPAPHPGSSQLRPPVPPQLQGAIAPWTASSGQNARPQEGPREGQDLLQAMVHDMVQLRATLMQSLQAEMTRLQQQRDGLALEVQQLERQRQQQYLQQQAEMHRLLELYSRLPPILSSVGPAVGTENLILEGVETRSNVGLVAPASPKDVTGYNTLSERLASERLASERLASERLASERLADTLTERSDLDGPKAIALDRPPAQSSLPSNHTISDLDLASELQTQSEASPALEPPDSESFSLKSLTLADLETDFFTSF
jgi:hypothetical protein